MMKRETPIPHESPVTEKGDMYTIQRPAPVPGQSLGVSVDRAGWHDHSAALTIALEVSRDQGRTWSHWCGMTVRGDGETPAVWVATPPPAGVRLRMSARTNGKPVQQPFAFVEAS